MTAPRVPKLMLFSDLLQEGLTLLQGNKLGHSLMPPKGNPTIVVSFNDCKKLLTSVLLTVTKSVSLNEKEEEYNNRKKSVSLQN